MTLNSTLIRARAGTLAILTTAALFSSPVYAAPQQMSDNAPEAMMDHKQAMTAPATFQKKTYALKGSVTVEQRGDQTVLVFSDDFRTKKGPDLKVFLSKNTVSDATGSNATTDAIRLGELTSNKGAQEYALPTGVSLSDYSSVLVHCEAFSKLWGGADIS
jgi:hypothetical protein